MNYKIETTKVNKSRLSEIDFDNIPFGKMFSDHMFSADYINGEWTNLKIIPFAPLELSPVNLALHYGQSIFEGMKASVDGEGNPLLFRPELHAQRFNASAERMCMPTIPEDLFVQAISNLVAIEKNWIPPVEGSALYTDRGVRLVTHCSGAGGSARHQTRQDVRPAHQWAGSLHQRTIFASQMHILRATGFMAGLALAYRRGAVSPGVLLTNALLLVRLLTAG